MQLILSHNYKQSYISPTFTVIISINATLKCLKPQHKSSDPELSWDGKGTQSEH